jgi:hypothetical protein
LLGGGASECTPSLSEFLALVVIPSHYRSLGLVHVYFGHTQLGQTLDDLIILVTLRGTLINTHFGARPSPMFDLQYLNDEPIAKDGRCGTAGDRSPAVGDRDDVRRGYSKNAQCVVRLLIRQDEFVVPPFGRRNDEPGTAGRA